MVPGEGFFRRPKEPGPVSAQDKIDGTGSPEPDKFYFSDKAAGAGAEPTEREIKNIERPPEPQETALADLSEDIVKCLSKDRGRLRDAESRIQNLIYRAHRSGGDLPTDADLQRAMQQVASRPEFAAARIGAENLAAAARDISFGVEGLGKAIATAEKERRPDENMFIGLNDFLDARYKIDAVQILYGRGPNAELRQVRLIQAKNSATGRENPEDIHRAHQEYVDLLLTMNDILDSRRRKESRLSTKETAKEFRGESSEERLKGMLADYESFFIGLYDAMGDAERGGKIPDEKEMAAWLGERNNVASVIEKFRQDTTMRKAAEFLAADMGLDQEEATRFVRYCGKVSAWAQDRTLTPAELAELHPDLQPDGRLLNMIDVESVLIEDGRVTSVRRLMTKGGRSVIKR